MIPDHDKERVHIYDNPKQVISEEERASRMLPYQRRQNPYAKKTAKDKDMPFHIGHLTTSAEWADIKARQRVADLIDSMVSDAGIKVTKVTGEEADSMLSEIPEADKLSTSKGVVYGWTKNGEIFINEDEY